MEICDDRTARTEEEGNRAFQWVGVMSRWVFWLHLGFLSVQRAGLARR